MVLLSLRQTDTDIHTDGQIDKKNIHTIIYIDRKNAILIDKENKQMNIYIDNKYTHRQIDRDTDK